MDEWEALQPEFTPTLHLLNYVQSQLNLFFSQPKEGEEGKEEEGIKPILICGGDLVASFNSIGVWRPDHVKGI